MKQVFFRLKTVFDPKNPVTKPSVEKSRKFESRFDYESMIQEALDTEEVVTVSPETVQKEVEDFL